MHAVDSLILDGGRPPGVRQDDLVGRHEVQADGAHGQAGEHDGAFGIGLQRDEGGVARGRAHGAVDAGEGVVVRAQLVLDHVQEGGPLAKDDGFGAWFAVRGFENAEERFGLAAACVHAQWECVTAFAQSRRRPDQLLDLEWFRTTHGAAVL